MSGLADLELQLLNLACASLDAACQPVPALANRYRYVSEPAVQNCCGDGVIYSYWSRTFPDRTGIPQGVGKPIGRQQADIFLRLFRCFPILNADGSAPDGLDAASASLTNDMDAIYFGLTKAICDGTLEPYLSGCDSLNLVDITPRQPRGGCAGLSVHLVASWVPWTGNC